MVKVAAYGQLIGPLYVECYTVVASQRCLLVVSQDNLLHMPEALPPSPSLSRPNCDSSYLYYSDVISAIGSAMPGLRGAGQSFIGRSRTFVLLGSSKNSSAALCMSLPFACHDPDVMSAFAPNGGGLWRGVGRPPSQAHL